MATIKILELAKEMNLPSKAIVDYLASKGAEVTQASAIGDAEINLIKKHFAKRPQSISQGQRPLTAQPQQRRMLEGPEDRTKRRPLEESSSKQPVRRMLDGPEDRKKTVGATANAGQRRMLEGPRPGSRPAGNNQKNNNGSRTINGVVISSDDGDRRLIHGSHMSEAELEAIKREKVKENKAKREAEKAEELRIKALKDAEAEAVAEKVRKEAAVIESDVLAAKEAAKAAKAAKAAEEAAKAAEEAAKAAEEAAKAAKAAEEAEKEKNTAKAAESAPQEKVFKTVGGPVRPNIVKRGTADSINRAAMGERPQGERRNFGDKPQGERRNFGDKPQGDRRNFGDRNQGDRRNFGDRNQGDRNQGDRNHYQAVESRYNGDNKGHSNLFEKESQRSYGNSGQGQRDNRNFSNRNNGFTTRPQGAFGGNKDEDDSRPVSHSRDTKKKTTGAPEFAESLKSANNRRNDKSKDKEKANKRFNDMDEMQGGKKGKNSKDPNRAGAFHRPEPVKAVVAEETIKTITLPDVLTIQELADKMKIKSSDIVKKLFLSGKMVTMNSDINFEEAEEIALEYEIICEHEEKIDKVAELLKESDEEEGKLIKRPPVVCVMGHVDHGKTSLLDAIRATSVTAREAGGITQHIGAYMVEENGEKITFLDTPGHEAFTAMRMRGANATDIAVLVVAADDGVMPQTIEAINHAKAAGVEIIVAVNKIDKPTANVDRVKQELTEYGLISEDWGGSTVFVPVSAKAHQNIDKLLEMILLTADVLELKANPDRKARGLVIEAQLDKGRGPVATVLVQKGTLKVGDNVVIGSSLGKVRALVNDKGEKVKVATPSMPVEILGLNSVPNSGEIVVATENEKEAREIAEAYIEQNKEKLIAETKSKMSLDGLFSQIKAGSIKELNIVVKADVQGSVEAIKQSLVKLSNDEVAVRIIHSGVGAVNESDATLASASNAIIIAFNVKPDNTAKDICEHENVDLRLYNVIYNAIDDVEAAMKGMLDPIFEEKIIAHAEVRQTFKASGVGTIAGSYVLDGKITRGCKARITRGKNQLFDGNLASLKRFKDDVKEVNAGYECGLVFEGFQDLLEGDQIELYAMVEVPRK